MSILCPFAVPEIGVNRNEICSDCVTSHWSCMHGLQVNLVSGMAQANDTKGGQMNPLLEGRQSFYLVHF